MFEGRVQSLKDVLRGMLNFVKDIMAQVAAQLATKAVLSYAVSLFSGNVNSREEAQNSQPPARPYDGGIVQRFAFGGPVMSNGDSVPALLTPGEFVVSRKGMETMQRLNDGQVPFGGGSGNLTVNVVNSGRDRKSTRLNSSHRT